MARSRYFGSDVDFCDWMRKCPDLPAYSPTTGFVATDVDLMIHRYMTEDETRDRLGTRRIQSMMHVEIKTRDGVPSASQADTLAKLHEFRGTIHGKFGCDLIQHYGVSIVSLSGTRPEDSERIRWGRFKNGVLTFREIKLGRLIQLFLFQRDPDSFTTGPFRRHHVTNHYVKVVTAPLGFEVEEHITHRS